MGGGLPASSARKTPNPGESGPECASEVFRPPGWLRWSVVVAVCFWMTMFFVLVSLRAHNGHAFAGTGFFVALFTVLAIFYNNSSVEVTGDKVIVRGLLSLRLLSFSDIVRVDVKPGLLQTNYLLLGRGKILDFNSTFAGHRRLFQLICDRAQLARL